MIVLQLLLYCLLFTAMVKIAVIGGAVNGLYFYPKEVQDMGFCCFSFFMQDFFYHTHRKSLPPKTIASVTRPQSSAQSHAATAEAGM